MPGLNELADWLGYEVIDVEGEFVVRHKADGAKGLWVEREARATAAEVHLYDAVRGLVGTAEPFNGLSAIHRIAIVLGVPVPGLTMLAVLEKLAGLLADNRHWREKANGCDEELVQARARIQRLEQQVADHKRLTPKGGDRGELVRQVRLVADALRDDDEKLWEGVTAMARAVLRLLGEGDDSPTGTATTVISVDSVIAAVDQIKADHQTAHPEGSRAFYLNRGEQTAYRNVIRLLEGNSVGAVEL